MANFEKVRNRDRKVGCEIDYDTLTVATKAGGKDILYGTLDLERIRRKILSMERAPPSWSDNGQPQGN